MSLHMGESLGGGGGSSRRQLFNLNKPIFLSRKHLERCRQWLISLGKGDQVNKDAIHCWLEQLEEPKRILREADSDDGDCMLTKLPTEILVMILKKLLVIDGEITLPMKANAPKPAVAILQTCKKIDNVGTVVLYSCNKFTVETEFAPQKMLMGFSYRKFRWTTIPHIASISYTCDRSDPNLDPVMALTRPRTVAKYTCTGKEIMNLFTRSDRWRSGHQPTRPLVVRAAKWISQGLREAVTDDSLLEIAELSNIINNSILALRAAMNP